MIRFAYLLGLTQATTVITNVVCNGHNSLTFNVDKDAAFGDAMFKFADCGLSSMNKPHDLTPQRVGNTNEWTVTFNPYDQCEGNVDPNIASSYSVDMKVIMSYQTTVNGVQLYAGAEEVNLVCTFVDEYTAEATLGVMDLPIDEYLALAPTAFEIGMDLFRKTTEGGDVTAADGAQVIAYNDVHFKAEGNTNFLATMFQLKITKVTLKKVSPAPEREIVLFDAGDISISQSTTFPSFASEVTTYFGSATIAAFNFRLWDAGNHAMGFSHKALLLDDDSSATYSVVVKAKACGVGSASRECNVASTRIGQSNTPTTTTTTTPEPTTSTTTTTTPEPTTSSTTTTTTPEPTTSTTTTTTPEPTTSSTTTTTTPGQTTTTPPIAPDTRSIYDISNLACFGDNEVFVNGEQGQWTTGPNIGTIHSNQMMNTGEYDGQSSCEWTFYVPAGKQLELRAVTFDVEPAFECAYDFLRIEYTDVTTGRSKCLTRHASLPYQGVLDATECLFCSFQTDVPENNMNFILPDDAMPRVIPVHATNDQKVILIFQSDADDNGEGFDIEWELK